MAGRGGFARELRTKSAREGPSNGGHFGNSGLYRLRNHGTSDGRTWTTPRAAASSRGTRARQVASPQSPP